MSNLDLVEALCAASVPLREARRVHLQSYGALVPHVFMGDVLKRIGECLATGVSHAKATYTAEVQGILSALERGMTEGERETRNVIAVSFAGDSELEVFFDELRPLMGPRTRAQLQGK
jgi:predicted deacylase